MVHPLSIWVLGDGKPGHENQSLGLAEALGRLHPCEVHSISLAGANGLVRRLRAALGSAGQLPKPDLILAAGHATHPALLWLARKYHARSIVLMRPSLPLGWFDLCLAPEHDFSNAPDAARVITTLGALNRVQLGPPDRRHGSLILVGGPSSSHDWDESALLANLAEILPSTADGPWQLADSRRTPDGLVSRLRESFPGLEVVHHADTRRERLPARLAEANAVWVAEDSVSMVYEALSSGAKVGLLPVPRKRADTRVLRGIQNLLDRQFITSFATWRETRELLAPPHPLREADRCAQLVMDRFFT